MYLFGATASGIQLNQRTMGVSTSTPFGIVLKAIVGALALQMLGDSKVLVSISTTQQVEEDTR